jgi:extradiol dioxygenase family protein
MDPVLHLSIPVVDLAVARDFYLDVVGCGPGRVRDGWCDVWFYGLQLTLQEQPHEVSPDGAHGVRHFGVTLDADAFDELMQRLERVPTRWVTGPNTDQTLDGKTSAKVMDPSGNLIEIKTYDDPSQLFGPH